MNYILFTILYILWLHVSSKSGSLLYVNVNVHLTQVNIVLALTRFNSQKTIFTAAYALAVTIVYFCYVNKIKLTHNGDTENSTITSS